MSLTADLGAFGAAARKEWRVLRRYPATFVSIGLWPLLLPAVYLLQANGFVGGERPALEAFASRAGTTEVAAFLYVGWSIHMWLSAVLWGPGSSLREEQVRGSLESLFLTPASRLAVLFGPAPAHLLPPLWMFVVIGLTLRFGFGLSVGPAELLRALLVLVVSVPVLLGVGAAFAAAALRFQDINGLVQAVRGLLAILCGVSFPIVVLPEWARAVALSLPPTHMIGAVRAALLEAATLAELRPGLLLLAAMGLAACAAAMVLLARTETAARRSGSLGQY
jgi:ABC-2 type transport system permease protein